MSTFQKPVGGSFWIPSSRTVSMSGYESDRFMLDNHIRPQAEFFLEGADIFRTEDKFDQKWLEVLNSRTGLDLAVLPSLKANSSRDIAGRAIETVQFSSSVRDLVARFYVRDYERFGYEIA